MTWRCCVTAGWAGAFARAYAHSTLGSFLRAYTFGHVRQLDAIAARLLVALAGLTALVRMDSAFYGRGAVHAALAGGAAVSVTVGMNAQIKAAIAATDAAAWTTIEYTDAVFDGACGRWISRAEVAEIAFTAFAGRRTPPWPTCPRGCSPRMPPGWCWP